MQFKRLLFTITFLLNLLLAGFTQEPRLLDHGGGVQTVEFSPVDATLVASAGESNIIKLWNLRNNTATLLRGHTGRVNSVAFSPDGALFASVSDDRTIKLWNVRNQQNIRTLQDGIPYRSVAFSPDGQGLATGGDRHVKLWDARRWSEITTLRHDKSVQAVAFSSDGQFLAAGDGSRDGPGTVKIWDVESRQVVVNLDANPKDIKAVEFSPDDRYLAGSGWNGHLKIWEVFNWELQHTIPNIGHYDIAFSPDGKMLASTGNGDVGLWWVQDGTKVAQLPGPTDWMHPVDFSHDGAFLAVGAEDGKLRIWRINTSLANGKGDGVRILHIDTYFQQLPKANSANGDNIPDPIPPPAVVRDFFGLDPFYEQWINVRGLPVIASARVNPYALKEAAWLILKMIGHRPDVLRALVEKRSRIPVIGHTEMLTEIPEYSHLHPNFYWDRRARGLGGRIASANEENLLDGGDRYDVLIHELAHTIHDFAMQTVDVTFDNRVVAAYDAAMENELWQSTYAATNKHEYWAESSQAWFHAHGDGGSFAHFGKTRADLKAYDPNLAALLTEVYGDTEWRYTPLIDRTDLPHLQGFDPRDAPTFQWPEALEETYAQLKDPNIEGSDLWINLRMYQPRELSYLLRTSRVRGESTEVLFFSLASFDVLVYKVSLNGIEDFIRRFPAGHHQLEWLDLQAGDIFVIKDTHAKNLAVFRAEEKTGRAIYVGDSDSQPQVRVPPSQRPPMYWIDTRAGTIHRLVGAKVETFLPSVPNATSLAVDMTDEKLYWTEKTSNRTGRIRRAHLDGTNVQLVRNLTSVPHSLTIDTVNDKLYLTNSWGKIQRLNFDGSNFEPNLIRGLDSPKYLVLNVAGGKLYWTETAGQIWRADLNGSNPETLATGLGALGSIDIANRKLYSAEQTGESEGRIQRANLNGTNVQTIVRLESVPLGIAVDAVRRKLYWTDSRGRIRRASLNGKNVQNVATGLRQPSGIVLGIGSGPTTIVAAPTMVELPDETGLLANYPNPFNPETWIPYQLSEPAEVTLTIYAVNGNVVRGLALGHQPAGMYHSKSHAAYWDGKNELSEAVASGVYFYTLSAGDFTATRKMFIRK